MSTKKITLKSSDGVEFEVDEAVASESQIIKMMIEDDIADIADNGIPLPKVTGKTLAKVIEYCKKHVEAAAAEPNDQELRNWDAEFVKLDQDMIFEIILAANYLNIQRLLDLTCMAVADLIKGKSVEEVREIFNIKNDFTAEEEAAVRRQNEWAFE